MGWKERVLCGWLNMHKGKPECIEGWMFFKCNRCGKLTHPIRPEKTEAITRELYAEDGYDYDEIHQSQER